MLNSSPKVFLKVLLVKSVIDREDYVNGTQYAAQIPDLMGSFRGLAHLDSTNRSPNAGKAPDQRVIKNSASLKLVELGRPQKAFIESANGTLRDECPFLASHR